MIRSVHKIIEEVHRGQDVVLHGKHRFFFVPWLGWNESRGKETIDKMENHIVESGGSEFPAGTKNVVLFGNGSFKPMRGSALP